MRKIDKQYENPFDNVLIDLCEKTNEFHKKLNFTPNTLTTLSLLFGLLACVLFQMDIFVLSTICVMVSYFYDCADGNYARKYKMASEFGDMYDHISDMTKTFLLIMLMFMKDINKFKIVFPIIIIFGMLSIAHLGCQEHHYNDSKFGKTLELSKKLCPGDHKESIKYTRFVGTGTFAIVMMLCVLFYTI